MKNLLMIILLIVQNSAAQSLVLRTTDTTSMSFSTQLKKNKNTSTAILMALGSTVIPTTVGLITATKNDRENVAYFGSISLAVAGIVIGPSVGSLYAQDYKRSIKGIAFRTLGGGLASLAIAQTFYGGPWNSDIGALVAIGGVGMLTTSMVWSYVKTPSSVKEYNARHKLSITPQYNPFNQFRGMSISYNF
ncbi:hypothetical protein K1X84_00590 [bacterium]|nr:hypothetical protein [bacterium]